MVGAITRLEEHVLKEKRLVHLWKDDELYFLKIIEDDGAFRVALWVWDTYPGERFKGLPVYLSEYSGRHATVKDVINFFKQSGFKVQHTPHAVPKWMRSNHIEERLEGFMENEN